MAVHPVTVKNVMKHPSFIIRAEKTVMDAAKLMKETDCGALPVGNGPEAIVGIITDRDILLRVMAEGKDAAHVRVCDVMTHTCDIETDIEVAAEYMRRHDVCSLMVTRKGVITGVLTLAELLSNQKPLQVDAKVPDEFIRLRAKSCPSGGEPEARRITRRKPLSKKALIMSSGDSGLALQHHEAPKK